MSRTQVFEQEAVFSYMSRATILNPDSRLWVTACIELVPGLCAAVPMAVYAEYRLWFVTPNVFALVRELGVAMSAALGSRANDQECLELFEIIESSRREQLPQSWHERTSWSVDRHHSCTGTGGDFVYYDSWQHRKIVEVAAHSWASASSIVQNNVNMEWDDMSRLPRDTSYNFVPRQVQTVFSGDPAYACLLALYFDAAVHSALTMPATGTTSDADRFRNVREFLEDAVVLSSTESVMSIIERCKYVCDRCVR